ncbi:MAG: hypothetical protein CM15mV148_050 [uncultured marine virus]|nr:MAG: hypothetical protein CM15mV148_050 [uncultured marine virus]
MGDTVDNIMFSLTVLYKKRNADWTGHQATTHQQMNTCFPSQELRTSHGEVKTNKIPALRVTTNAYIDPDGTWNIIIAGEWVGTTRQPHTQIM